MLAALGADVVRVADPQRPELPLLALDGGLGKRWAPLDLRTPAGRDGLEALLRDADLVVVGHRPGALDRFGLAPDALADRHPAAAIVTLVGVGRRWALRRPARVRLARAGRHGHRARGPVPSRPARCPCQALDHATGYLVAAAGLRLLAERARGGPSGRAALALAATARVLLDAGPRTPQPREPDPVPHLVTLGDLQVACPPGALDAARLAWPG